MAHSERKKNWLGKVFTQHYDYKRNKIGKTFDKKNLFTNRVKQVHTDQNNNKIGRKPQTGTSETGCFFYNFIQYI